MVIVIESRKQIEVLKKFLDEDVRTTVEAGKKFILDTQILQRTLRTAEEKTKKEKFNKIFDEYGQSWEAFKDHIDTLAKTNSVIWIDIAKWMLNRIKTGDKEKLNTPSLLTLINKLIADPSNIDLRCQYAERLLKDYRESEAIQEWKTAAKYLAGLHTE